MKCITDNGLVLAEQVEEASSFLKRLVGLMGRKNMAPGSALLLRPCIQIHTCFMRFAIDVLFVDKDGQVQYVLENLKPWRMSPIVYRASQTLELPGGSLQGRVKIGDKIYFK